jgi:hypothetical protein
LSLHLFTSTYRKGKSLSKKGKDQNKLEWLRFTGQLELQQLLAKTREKQLVVSGQPKSSGFQGLKLNLVLPHHDFDYSKPNGEFLVYCCSWKAFHLFSFFLLTRAVA